MTVPTRPYRTYPLNEPADVVLLANWLQRNGRGADDLGQAKAVSIATKLKRGHKGTVALATPNEVVTFDLTSPVAEPCLGVLRSVLLDQPQVDLRARDVYQDLIDLTGFFAKAFKIGPAQVYEALAPAFIGDLRSASNLLGLVSGEKTQYKLTEDDAYEVALYGPQYEASSTDLQKGYYQRLSLPLARLSAEGKLFGADRPVDWWVTLPDLWLRVVAHFTGDPTLGMLFREQLPVLERVAAVLKLDQVQTRALLLWQAHDREMGALAQRCPTVIEQLPEELPKWARELDLHFPVLCAGTLQMREAYWHQRAAHTLYGRMLRPGHSSGEAVAHRIFGTVEDIIAVAAVTYWQNRISREIMVTNIEGGLDSALIRIKGVGPSAGKQMWKQVLEPLAGLGGPMSISLFPTVVFP